MVILSYENCPCIFLFSWTPLSIKQQVILFIFEPLVPSPLSGVGIHSCLSCFSWISFLLWSIALLPRCWFLCLISPVCPRWPIQIGPSQMQSSLASSNLRSKLLTPQPGHPLLQVLHKPAFYGRVSACFWICALYTYFYFCVKCAVFILTCFSHLISTTFHKSQPRDTLPCETLPDRSTMCP